MSSAGPERSSFATVAAVAVCAYAACDMIHEVLGHGTATLLVPGVHAISLSTVALQSVGKSRLVAAAGTVANLVVGAIAFALARRGARFTAFGFFLLLLGALNLFNGTGYFLFSAILGVGDWSVVISDLEPQLAWRAGLGLVGLLSYVWAVRMAAGGFTRLIRGGLLARAEVRRLAIVSYVVGGLLFVAGSALNPISPRLILLSGASSGFEAMAGLLFVPAVVERRTAEAQGVGVLRFSGPWVAAGILVAAVFIAVIGPGIRL